MVNIKSLLLFSDVMARILDRRIIKKHLIFFMALLTLPDL